VPTWLDLGLIIQLCFDMVDALQGETPPFPTSHLNCHDIVILLKIYSPMLYKVPLCYIVWPNIEQKFGVLYVRC